MSEMVERGVQQIRTLNLLGEYGLSDKEEIGIVRAVIAGLREPTEGMELAGDQVGHYSDAPAATSVWQAMIDEALK